MSISFPINKEGLTIHRVKGTINNIFLMECSCGFFLIDPGVSSDIKRVEEYLKEKSILPENIKLIIVSHMHPDHSGGAIKFRAKYKTPIAAHKRARFWYKGTGGFIQYLLDCYMTVMVAKRRKEKIGNVFFKRDINPEYPLDDNDPIPLFKDWKAVHVPGHTVHDIVLINKEEKILYAADQIIEVKKRFFLPLPVLFKEKMAESYKKMSLLKAKTILLAHGEPFIAEDPYSLYSYMEQLLEKPRSKFVRRIEMISGYSPELKKFQ